MGTSPEEVEKILQEIREEFEILGIKPMTPEEQAKMEETARKLGEELCSNIRSHKPDCEK